MQTIVSKATGRPMQKAKAAAPNTVHARKWFFNVKVTKFFNNKLKSISEKLEFKKISSWQVVLRKITNTINCSDFLGPSISLFRQLRHLLYRFNHGECKQSHVDNKNNFQEFSINWSAKRKNQVIQSNWAGKSNLEFNLSTLTLIGPSRLRLVLLN